MNLLETSYPVVRILAYSVNCTRRLMRAPRLCWSDTGLAMHLSQEDEPRGAHLENPVLQDLLAWRDSPPVRADVLHWRTATGEEMDFVTEAQGALCHIEVNATVRPLLLHAANLRSFRAEHGRTVRPSPLLHGGDSLEWLTADVLAAPWWKVL